MSEPLLEVVLPTRGRPTLLGEAVTRLLAQTEAVRRVTVVNDGDREAVAGLPFHPAVRVVSNARPPGAPGARNTGLALADAEWVAFHDDDDLWDPGFAARVGAACAAASDDVVAVFSGYRVAFPDRAPRLVLPPAEAPSVDALLERNAAGPCTFVACRRRAVAAAGGFDEALPGAQDWDLWLRLAQLGRLLPVAECLGTYRVHAADRISAAAPVERFRRYRPFFVKRERHPLAGRHRAAFSAEISWWGVLMAWTGETAAAAEALAWAARLQPGRLRTRAMLAIVRSPLRRPLLRLIYGPRRTRMRLEDRAEILELR